MAYTIPQPNQSVSGAVTTQAGSILSTTHPAGSITAISGAVTQLAGSILAVDATFTPPANQSVSGAVSVSNFPAIQVVAPNNSSLFALQPAGSILAVDATFTPPANQSVSGEVSVSNFPAVQVVAPNNSSMFAVPVGSYVTLQPPGSVMAVSGSFTPPANQSVSGEVAVSNFPAIQPVTNLAGSITAVAGTVTANIGTIPGSMVAFQGTSPWVVAPNNSSMITTNVGSVITVFQSSSLIARVTGSVATLGIAGSIASVTNPAGSITAVNINGVGNPSVIVVLQAPSIVGTYAEDAAHTTADKGFFVMGVRNDTVASFAGANGEYNPFGHDSAGRMITKPFAPGEASQIGTASTVNFGTTNAASIRLFLAPGAGLKNYVTDFNISNTGATTTLVSFVDEDASVIGKTIAPAGGGSNHSFNTPLVTQLPNKAVGVIAANATSTLHITMTGYKAP